WTRSRYIMTSGIRATYRRHQPPNNIVGMELVSTLSWSTCPLPGGDKLHPYILGRRRPAVKLTAFRVLLRQPAPGAGPPVGGDRLTGADGQDRFEGQLAVEDV